MKRIVACANTMRVRWLVEELQQTGIDEITAEGILRAVLPDLSALRLSAGLYEYEAVDVRNGDPIGVNWDGSARRRFTGRIDFITQTVGLSSRRVRIRAEMPHRGGESKPDINECHSVREAPREALRPGDPLPFDSGSPGRLGPQRCRCLRAMVGKDA